MWKYFQSLRHVQKEAIYQTVIYSSLCFFKYEQLAKLPHYSFVLVFTYNTCFVPKNIESTTVLFYLVVVSQGLTELQRPIRLLSTEFLFPRNYTGINQTMKMRRPRPGPCSSLSPRDHHANSNDNAMTRASIEECGRG